MLRELVARVTNTLWRRDPILDRLNWLTQAAVAAQRDALLNSPRYADHRRLMRFGAKLYSQGDEDGIIQEIFKRIQPRNRYFVEFGVENGLQNNTAALLLHGWSGAWIEGNAASVAAVQRHFRQPLSEGRLKIRHAFVTAESIESEFASLGVLAEPDLLSIDIDRNDYWVWNAIVDYRPRVVVIEYNPSFGPIAKCVVRYNPTATWDRTNFCGASLAALESLGREKGYSLVGCSFLGVNAFFVRNDLVGDHFCGPFTSENHYEPARFGYIAVGGHPPGWGDLEFV